MAMAGDGSALGRPYGECDGQSNDDPSTSLPSTMVNPSDDILLSSPSSPSRRLKKRRRRRSDVAQWTDHAVKVLIGVLRLLRCNGAYDDEENSLAQTSQVKNVPNKHIWKCVSRAMQLKGHNFDAGQCKTKFKGLKAEYQATLDLLGFTNCSHSEIPDGWDDLPNLSSACREKARKFKFFHDMKGYYVGSPVCNADSLFEGIDPDEFLKSLEAFRDSFVRSRREEDSSEKEAICEDRAYLETDESLRQLWLLKQKMNRAVNIEMASSKLLPDELANRSWNCGFFEELETREQQNVEQAQSTFDGSHGRRSHCWRKLDFLYEQELKKKEDYRARKLQIEEKKLQLAERRIQIELVRAENEKQRLLNEMRRTELEERRAKQQEEQMLSPSSVLSLLANFLTQRHSIQ